MKKFKILLIDDEELIRDAITERLTKDHYTVVWAENGKIGLELLPIHNPKVIILDLKMPVMGGIDFLKALNDNDKKKYSIIVLTGYGRDEDIKKCYDLGVNSFLKKPVNRFELVGAVKRSFELINYSQKLEQEVIYREKINKELEEQKKILNDTFNGLAEGVIKIDNNFNIKMISNKACNLIGIKEKDFINKSAVSLLGQIIAGPSGLLITNSNDKKNFYDIKTELVCPNGSKIPLLLTQICIKIDAKKHDRLLLFQNLLEKEKLIRSIAKSIGFGNMIGYDPKIRNIFNLVEKVAPKSSNILIEGESGTGKSLLAKEIHDRSKRSQNTFSAINCSAIPYNLMESELFGYEKGAFTGATQSKKGLVEIADKGTLFLDEIGDIPLELQGKLLSVLQEKTFMRVGGTKQIACDIRVISATNKNLKDMVDKKLFRLDLYYRINVVSIKLPSLSERLQDIPLLCDTFIEEFNTKEKRNVFSIDKKAMNILLNYSWPGNIRELHHAIEYAFAISDSDTIKANQLPTNLYEPTLKENVSSFNSEKEMILNALTQSNFRKEKAARLLGINRTTLYRKLKKYEI